MKLSYKEDFTSGTEAAAAGGFTTVLDMPNTQPPTDSARRLLQKMSQASKRILVNVGFHVAATRDRKASKAMKAVGAVSMKLYLPKPISPLDVSRDKVIVEVMESADYALLPITVHAEDATTFENDGNRTFRDLVRSRPWRAETKAVLRMLRLQKSTVSRIHFCHVTLPSSISSIWNVSSGRVTSEVTPHHALLADSEARRLGWKAWMVPPLRSKMTKDGLFRTLVLGNATIIATDHAPHTVREKKRPEKSPAGVPGLETAMPVMLTMMNKGKISLGRLVSLLSTNPARVFGLRRKGTLERGCDGDLVLVDVKKKGKIDPENFLSKAHYSPFEGWRTIGGIHSTIVNGRVVYDDGEIVEKPGAGTVLRTGRCA